MDEEDRNNVEETMKIEEELNLMIVLLVFKRH